MGPTAVATGAYTLGEVPLAGYNPGTWGCTGNATPLVGNVLTITTADAGAAIVCSITNTFSQPTLALNKVVVNTGGGTAVPAAFTLSASGPTPLSGTAPVGPTAVATGAYTLGEVPLAGYNPGTWGCTGNATPLVGNVLTITTADAGAAIVCSITNTFSQPTLALNKVVVNTGGGTAVPAAFTLSASGPTPLSGTAPVGPTAVATGDYTLDEVPIVGYNPGTWGCTGNATPLVGNVLTITAADAGAAIACSITNTFNRPELALEKVVVNTGGGTATAANFTLTATGPTVISGTAPVAATDASLGAYTLTESRSPATAPASGAATATPPRSPATCSR